MKKIRFLMLTLVALIAGAVSSSAKTVYIQPNAWANDNAVVSLWVWVDGNDGSWATLTSVEDGIYKATIDNEDINRMKIARGTAENLWQFNETGVIDISDYDGKLFSIDANSWSGITVGSGITVSDYTEPLLRDYYLESDAALGFGGWNATEGNKMVKGDDDKFTLTKENVLLTVGNYNFKTYCSYGSGTWYPADNNQVLEITENGFYTVAFTFDLATGVPTVVATKTKAIGYLVDFNTEIVTSNADFTVASKWKHIVHVNNDYDNNMYYQFKSEEGVNGTGALFAAKQKYYDNGQESWGATTTYDMLVTPIVSGTVTIYVKAYTNASSSNKAFLEFWSLKNGNTERDAKLVRWEKNDGTTEYEAVTIEVSEPQRLGIRAQYVYLDNFIADYIDETPEAALSVTAVMNSDGQTGTGGTNPVFAQQEDGNMKVILKITLSNTGDVDFVAGETENYTLTPAQASSASGTKTYYEDCAIDIPESLAVGETKTFDVEFTVPYASGWKYWFVKENVTGTTSSSYRYASSAAYEPIFVFRAEGSTSTSNLSGDIAFGKISEETSKSYEIYNDGTAPLQVKTITVHEGFTVDNTGNFTLAAKEKQTITITLPVTTTGIFSGNLEIVYVDKTGADATYTKAVTGTVLDSSKNIITFDDGQGNKLYPQGSVRYNTYISSEGSGDSKNYYLQGSGSNPLYITPLMSAAAGESITFDAENSGSSSGKVEVMISTDRTNWTTIQTISNIASQYNWTTYTATIPEAGNYYLGFKLTSSKVDNIYGLVYAPAPAHDLLLIDSDVPATATQNKDYTATVSVGNVGPNAEAAGSYTASLYVDGEEVATANDVDLPVAVISGNYNNGEEENYTVLSFTYKPHTPGTFPAYIEVKAGDVVLTTEEVELVIAEEKVTGDAGTAVSGTTSNTPLNLVYCNSESVSLYTGAMLGLEAGDKISSITWKGYCTSDKEVATNLSIYYEWTEDAEQAQPAAELYNTEGMTAIVENQLTNWEAKGSYNEMADYIVVNFDEPLVYEEGKNLRLVVRSINPEGQGTSNYKSATFEKADVTGTWCYAYWNDNDRTLAGTHSAQGLPAIHLGLVVEPTVLAGTVTDANGAVEGATVTLRNEANDVEYAATTNADGQYEINVIQDKLTYIAVADAEGLVAPVQVVESFSTPVNFALAEPAYGEIWAGDAANAAITAGYFKYLAQGGDRLMVSYTEEGATTKTIKFTKPDSWNVVTLYAWGGDVSMNWPGVEQTETYLNEYNQTVYVCTIPEGATGILFTNGEENNTKQTVDITNFNVTGYYTDGTEDSQKHLNVFSWTDPSTATIELLDVSGKVVAEGYLNDGVAEIGLDGDVIDQLAKGIIVNVKATGATITKVELAEPAFYVLEENAEGVKPAESVNVKIARNFKQGWNAIVLPFDLSATEIAETFGETAEVAYFDGDENVNGNVSISFKKGTSIYHGTPYLLYLPEAKSDVRFMSKAVSDASETAAGTTFDFVGVYERTDINAGDYFIASGVFKKATSNNYVLPFRSYLQLKASGVRSVNITIGDDTITTAIDGLTIENVDNVIYNLGGQKVQSPQKGLYIINGKKVVVK